MPRKLYETLHLVPSGGNRQITDSIQADNIHKSQVTNIEVNDKARVTIKGKNLKGPQRRAPRAKKSTVQSEKSKSQKSSPQQSISRQRLSPSHGSQSLSETSISRQQRPLSSRQSLVRQSPIVSRSLNIDEEPVYLYDTYDVPNNVSDHTNNTTHTSISPTRHVISAEIHAPPNSPIRQSSTHNSDTSGGTFNVEASNGTLDGITRLNSEANISIPYHYDNEDTSPLDDEISPILDAEERRREQTTQHTRIGIPMSTQTDHNIMHAQGLTKAQETQHRTLNVPAETQTDHHFLRMHGLTQDQKTQFGKKTRSMGTQTQTSPLSQVQGHDVGMQVNMTRDVGLQTNAAGSRNTQVNASQTPIHMRRSRAHNDERGSQEIQTHRTVAPLINQKIKRLSNIRASFNRHGASNMKENVSSKKHMNKVATPHAKTGLRRTVSPDQWTTRPLSPLALEWRGQPLAIEYKPSPIKKKLKT